MKRRAESGAQEHAQWLTQCPSCVLPVSASDLHAMHNQLKGELNLILDSLLHDEELPTSGRKDD